MLRKQGLQVFHYLDDILLVAQEPQILTELQELPPEKATTVASQVEKISTLSYLSASQCLKLGSLAATIPMVKRANWRMRTFQVEFLKQ